VGKEGSQKFRLIPFLGKRRFGPMHVTDRRGERLVRDSPVGAGSIIVYTEPICDSEERESRKSIIGVEGEKN